MTHEKLNAAREALIEEIKSLVDSSDDLAQAMVAAFHHPEADRVLELGDRLQRLNALIYNLPCRAHTATDVTMEYHQVLTMDQQLIVDGPTFGGFVELARCGQLEQAARYLTTLCPIGLDLAISATACFATKMRNDPFAYERLEYLRANIGSKTVVMPVVRELFGLKGDDAWLLLNSLRRHV